MAWKEDLRSRCVHCVTVLKGFDITATHHSSVDITETMILATPLSLFRQALEHEAKHFAWKNAIEEAKRSQTNHL